MNPAHVLPDHDIAVVIVNYNSAEMSLNAMQSIFDKTADTNSIHIHVVDNASPDDCATVLRKEISGRGWASQTTLYEETTNHGFGRGNNVALNAIAAMDQKPEKVMFLNPDACLQSDVITNLSKRLDQQPDVAIAGSAIRDEHGEVAVAAFRFPNILGVFADAVNFGPISGLFANWRAPIEPMPTTETDVDWVTGAAFMARFDAIERVGFFNQNFFLYFEEVDLMKVVRADGGTIASEQPHFSGPN